MRGKLLTALRFLLLLVVGVAWAQRTDVSRLFPIYNNGGKPDLTVIPSDSSRKWKSWTGFSIRRVVS